MVCNLCGSEDLVLLYPGNMASENLDRFSQYSYYGDLFKCNECGLVSQLLTHEYTEILESLKGEKYLDESIGELNLSEKALQFKGLIGLMQKFASLDGARLLDVGANTGVFLNLMREYTSDYSGIEPSEEAVKVAKVEFGLEVENSVVADATLPDGTYDLITMWDVVEHLYDPLMDTATLFNKLKPGGMVFITTHDVDSFLAKVTKKNYPMFMYQHFYHFSPKTLSKMMVKNGYEVLGVRYFNKTWTFGYLCELLIKLWPDNMFARALHYVLSGLLRIPYVGKLPIKIPLRDFFLLVARRPY